MKVTKCIFQIIVINHTKFHNCNNICAASLTKMLLKLMRFCARYLTAQNMHRSFHQSQLLTVWNRWSINRTCWPDANKSNKSLLDAKCKNWTNYILVRLQTKKVILYLRKDNLTFSY